MASNLLVIVILVLVSFSVTSAYSLSTRDAVLKEDDESYFMATSNQGFSTLDIEDLAKARSLQALVDGSKVVVNKASSKDLKSFKHKSKKVGSLDILTLVGIIIVAVIVTIVNIGLLVSLYLRLKAKKAQSTGQEKVNGSLETQTSKTEDRV